MAFEIWRGIGAFCLRSLRSGSARRGLEELLSGPHVLDSKAAVYRQILAVSSRPVSLVLG